MFTVSILRIVWIHIEPNEYTNITGNMNHVMAEMDVMDVMDVTDATDMMAL